MSRNVLHHLRNITIYTSTLYVTDCDLETSCTFTKTVKITGHTRFRYFRKHNRS